MMHESELTVDASELKMKFGQYLDEASHHPVIIRKSKREVAALISMGEYLRLQGLDDELWKLKADLAVKEGFIGTDNTMKLFKELLDREG